jgi:SAM-dependent methyltransferase
VASVIASYWIYDVSPLYRWNWIPDVLGMAPRRWLNLHAGLDESSTALRAVFASGEGETGDFFDPAEMSEDSIHRARAERERVSEPARVNFRNLPYPDQVFDNVFLLFAAHELRRATSREALFREVHRVLDPAGRILLVEHVRDLANLAVFGPGFFHFMTAHEWRRLARVAGLQVVGERRMTPFVKIILLKRNP